MLQSVTLERVVEPVVVQFLHESVQVVLVLYDVHIWIRGCALQQVLDLY